MEVSFNKQHEILSSSSYGGQKNYSTGVQVSNKTRVFDINSIGNRL